MSPAAAGADCPHCLSVLEPDGQEAGAWRCPICNFGRRACPECGSEMWKQVEPPAGLSIEADGLALEACEVLWVCRDPQCGARREAAL